MYLHGVHDPGNVGTILRSADAFGASSVAIGPATADPFGPKAVRASMGAVFAVPLAHAADPGELPGHTIALATDASATLSEAVAQAGSEITLLIGSEREGLPDEITAEAAATARIPIHTHSLNAAMAAAIALYEATTRMARA